MRELNTNVAPIDNNTLLTILEEHERLLGAARYAAVYLVSAVGVRPVQAGAPAPATLPDGAHLEQRHAPAMHLDRRRDEILHDARDAVFAIATAVANLCRIRGGTDPAFGVERALWTVCGSETESQFDQYAGPGGRVATLKFRIRYEARP